MRCLGLCRIRGSRQVCRWAGLQVGRFRRIYKSYDGFIWRVMDARTGTYALLLEAITDRRIQIGRWRAVELQRGYYVYIGSAFGPGGVRARVLRHQRVEKKNHWHIDYLRQHCNAVGAWYTYDPDRLEHEWASSLNRTDGYTAIKGFGCSDCRCDSHLFYTPVRVEVEEALKEYGQMLFWYEACKKSIEK